MGATPATLEKTRILGAYFRTLNDDDLRRAAVYMSGRAFPPSKRRTLGLGWSTVSKVVSSLSEREEDELGTIFRKHADLGDWAGEALDGSTKPEPVTLADVEASLGVAGGDPHRAWKCQSQATGIPAHPYGPRECALLHQDRFR